MSRFAKKKSVQWKRVFFLIIRLLIISFVFVVAQDKFASLIPAYESVFRKTTGFLYIVVLIIFVVKPILEAVGEKVSPLPWERRE